MFEQKQNIADFFFFAERMIAAEGVAGSVVDGPELDKGDQGQHPGIWIYSLAGDWWRRVDSNHGPTDYETVALAT